MAADRVGPKRPWIVDQRADQPAPARRVTERATRCLRYAMGEEPLQAAAVFVEDAERRVAGTGDLDGRHEDAIEHSLDVELRDDRSPRLEEPLPAAVGHQIAHAVSAG